MTAEVRLIVAIHTKPGRSQEQIELFERIAPLVRAEAGCVSYELHRVQGDDDRLVILERWASAAALAAHDESPHMVAADAETPAFRAEPAHVTVLTAAL